MERRSRSREKEQKEDGGMHIIDVYNIPEHHNKEDIVYFLWKSLEKCRALKKNSNPITKSDFVAENNCIRLVLRSKEEALNCLDLNGIYYVPSPPTQGVKSFYMKSNLRQRDHPLVDLKGLKIRRISPTVRDCFNKIYVGNFPLLSDHEVINILSEAGELKSFQAISTSKTGSQCFCEFRDEQMAEEYLAKINQLKIKGRPIIAKRAALMNTSETSKLGAVGKSSSSATTAKTVSRPKSNVFEKDLNSFYLTFDTVGFFKPMKISCVLLLRAVIPQVNADAQFVKQDLKKELEKVGKVLKIASR